jgi:hypothetical protein
VESAWYADRQDDQHGDGEERYGNAAFWPEVPIAYECQQKPDDSQDDERISSPVPTGPVAWADLKTGVSPQPEHHAKRTQRGAARTYPQPENHAKSIRRFGCAGRPQFLDCSTRISFRTATGDRSRFPLRLRAPSQI